MAITKAADADDQKMTVAQFLTRALSMSEKTQAQVAAEIGYEKQNIIYMFKRGITKVPINKIGPLAQALDVDGVHLLRLALEEYQPDTWAVIQAIMGKRLITEAESNIVAVVRAGALGVDVFPETDEEIADLIEMAGKWRERKLAAEDVDPDEIAGGRPKWRDRVARAKKAQDAEVEKKVAVKNGKKAVRADRGGAKTS